MRFIYHDDEVHTEPVGKYDIYLSTVAESILKIPIRKTDNSNEHHSLGFTCKVLVRWRALTLMGDLKSSGVKYPEDFGKKKLKNVEQSLFLISIIYYLLDPEFDSETCNSVTLSRSKRLQERKFHKPLMECYEFLIFTQEGTPKVENVVSLVSMILHKYDLTAKYISYLIRRVNFHYPESLQFELIDDSSSKATSTCDKPDTIPVQWKAIVKVLKKSSNSVLILSLALKFLSMRFLAP